MRKVLLIIDPQNDFVDPSGTLYIPNAEEGIKEICRVLDNSLVDYQDIILTQDTHQSYHIGHSTWWKNNPEPFTEITEKDVKSGKYIPLNKSRRYAISYINRLPGKTHKIWPVHCLEGSWGGAFSDDLIKSITDWQIKKKGRQYSVIKKGYNPDNEMYSVLSRADYPGGGLSTNTLIKQLSSYDEVYISGFAADVCVAWTVKDLLSSGMFEGKLRFLKNCMIGLDPNSEMLKVFDDGINNHGAIWVY